MDHLRLNAAATMLAIAYIVVTAPLLFYFYAAVGKRYALRGTFWQVTKVLVSLAALSILWFAILHVGEPGKEQPFAYVFSAFYAAIMGVIYVAVDRYVRQN
jgi:hypothetical protein